MADNKPKNPFADYTPDEQAEIRSQLVSLRDSKKLNHKQLRGVIGALEHLGVQQMSPALEVQAMTEFAHQQSGSKLHAPVDVGQFGAMPAGDRPQMLGIIDPVETVKHNKGVVFANGAPISLGLRIDPEYLKETARKTGEYLSFFKSDPKSAAFEASGAGGLAHIKQGAGEVQEGKFKAGAASMGEGAFEAATPLMLIPAVKAPAALGMGLFGASLGSHGAQFAAEKAGLDEDWQRLAALGGGLVGGVAAGGKAAYDLRRGEVVKSIRENFMRQGIDEATAGTLAAERIALYERTGNPKALEATTTPPKEITPMAPIKQAAKEAVRTGVAVGQGSVQGALGAAHEERTPVGKKKPVQAKAFDERAEASKAAVDILRADLKKETDPARIAELQRAIVREEEASASKPPALVEEGKAPDTKLADDVVAKELTDKFKAAMNVDDAQAQAGVELLRANAEYHGMSLTDYTRKYIADIRRSKESDLTQGDVLNQDKHSGTPEGAARDNDFVAQAKQELGEGASISSVLLKAQELKDKAKSDKLYQSDDPWGLKSENIIENKMGNKPQSAAAIANLLTKNGVSKAELKWLGLGDLLEGRGQKPISKQELLDHINENRITLEDVTYGTPKGGNELAIKSAQKRIELDNIEREARGGRDRMDAVADTILQERHPDKALSEPEYEVFRREVQNLIYDHVENGNPDARTQLEGYFGQYKDVLTEHFDLLERAHQLEIDIAELEQGMGGGARHENYSLPGGDNYREVVLKVDGKAFTQRDAQGTYPKYQSGHWEDANPVVHMRLKDRVDSKGRKTLFVEEWQSDWAQEGRERGFRGGRSAELEALQKQYAESVRKREEYYNKALELEGHEKQIFLNLWDGLRAEQSIIERRVAAIENNELLKPNPMPWPEDVHKLVVKRLLRMAAEEGYDAIAWAGGDVHRNRWGTDVISVAKDEHGKPMYAKSYVAGDHGPGIRDITPDIELTKKDAHKTIWTSDLGSVVSDPQIRAKVLKREQELKPLDPNNPRPQEGTAHIDTRGEGFRAVYDELTPKAFESHLKRNGFDTRIEDAEFSYPKDRGSDIYDVRTPDGELHEVHGNERYAQEYATRFKGEVIGRSPDEVFRAKTIPISEEMKDGIKAHKDFLFAKNKGAVEFLKDGRAIIHGFKSADFSTMVHEVSHVMRRNMPEADRIIAENWLGVEKGKWTVAAEEAFARGFERYLRDGFAPTERLAEVFQRAKIWLTGIYKRWVRGAPEITPEARIMYDRLLGGGKQYPDPLDKIPAVIKDGGWTEKARAAVESARKTLVAWDEKNLPRVRELDDKIADHKKQLKRAKEQKLHPVPEQQKLWLVKEIDRFGYERQLLLAQRENLSTKLTKEIYSANVPAKKGRPGKTLDEMTPSVPAKLPTLEEATAHAPSAANVEAATKAREAIQGKYEPPVAPAPEAAARGTKADVASAEKPPAKGKKAPKAKKPKVEAPATQGVEASPDVNPNDVKMLRKIMNLREKVHDAQAKGLDPEGIVSDAMRSGIEAITGVSTEGMKAHEVIHKLGNWLQAYDTQEYLKKAKTPPQETPAAEPVTQPGTPMGKDEITAWERGRTIEAGIQKRFPQRLHEPNYELMRKASIETAKGNRMMEFSLYNKALEAYAKALKAKEEYPLLKAIDAAKGRGERGAVGNRKRYTDPEIVQISKDHLESLISTYEQMSESELASSKKAKRLLEPAIEHELGLVGDPNLTNRYAALKARMNVAKWTDPIDALSKVIDGETFRASDMARMTMRERLGEMKRSRDQLHRKLKDHIADWDKRSIRDSLRFIDDMERGDYNNMTPRDKAMAVEIRNILDSRRDAIYGLGKGFFESYLENYFPHLWQHPTKISNIVARITHGKRPLQSSSSFLKGRVHEFFSDGIKAGLEPVTYNPIKMALLRAHTMDRFLMAHSVMESWKAAGIAKWVKNGKSPDPGWVRVDDSIFKPRVMKDGALASYGEYWAPAEAARIMHNYLMPGLRGSVVGDAMMGINNHMNMLNLGLSAFHAWEVSRDAIISDMSLAMQKVFRAKDRDLKGAAIAATRSASLVGSIAGDFMRGNRLMREYLEPGSYLKYSAEAAMIERAGGQIGLDPVYRGQARENLNIAWKQALETPGFRGKVGPVLTGTWNSLGAVMEIMSTPIMEKFVPRMKLGAFARLAEDSMKHHAGKADEVLAREIQRDWDSIDNRIGEVVYDNMFMNKVAKDLNHLMWRSVGWNLGTLEELVGGAVDLATAGKYRPGMRGATRGRMELTRRAAYALTLPVMTAYMSALTMYAMSGKPPEELTDYFYPKTGNIKPDGKPERVYGKTYMQDIIAWFKHPVTTLGHKLAPIWLASWDIFVKNANFYGVEIRHTDDPMLQQGIDVAKYALSSQAPFSIQNLIERKRQGSEGVKAYSSLFSDIIPAPAWVGQSEMEQWAFEETQRMMAGGPKTKVQFEKAQKLRRLRADIYNKGNFESAVNALDMGTIAPDDLDKLVEEFIDKQPPLERHFKQIPAATALEGYIKHASPEERARLRLMLIEKISDKDPSSMTPEERDYFYKQVDYALRLPVKEPETKK
jgi:hypothetical protein